MSGPAGSVADSTGNWVDTLAPAWLRPYLRLARLDRPIGSWLLLIPCWWSSALAAVAAHARAPSLAHIVLFFVGAFAMRGAGCTWNDIVDRNLDAAVERTRSRPIPSGQVSVTRAAGFLVLQALIGLAVLLSFNGFTVALGIASLAIVAVYPFMKRITYWPQAFLGLTFNWGAIMGWAAVTGRVGWGAILLYAAGFCWTLVYDTIYAHQDARDDATAGVKSTALWFGRHSRLWLLGFALALLALLELAGDIMNLGPVFQYALIPVAAHLAWLVLLWKIDDPRDCLSRFQASRWTGLLVVLALVLGRLFH